MWPFKQKTTKIENILALEQKWVVAEGIYANEPLMMRCNVTVKDWIGHNALPIKLGFAIPLNTPCNGGLPHSDENDRISEIEDIIIEEVKKRATGLQVLSLTTGVMKEFIFYISNGADIEGIHKAVLERVETHDVQCMAVNDCEWSSYREFMLKT